MARCPDCNKFTGLENADPEVDESSIDSTQGAIDFNYNVRMVRQCADCGQEMKSYDGEAEAHVELEDIEEFQKLPDSIREGLIDGSISYEVSADTNAEVEESGGGRYKKNIITATVTIDYTVSFTVGKKDYKLAGQTTAECEAAAGDFEECF